jgi:uncharacterized RDD family membrane protein YckC
MTEEELIKKFESDNVTLASLYKRAAAYMIDFAFIVILIFFVFFDMISAAGQDDDSIKKVAEYIIPYFVAVNFLYQTFFVYLYGATLGKIAVKIRVVYLQNGAKPIFWSAFMRSVVRFMGEATYYIGFLWAVKDRKKQTWHDIAAQTLVVNA